ncbi:glycosyltransferase family 2 protein [Salipiger mucosus]|uniref:Glucosyltransferase n=1 Tax=Salipiger mucosus DSM 16094 TaxID=1123237 RepID=S9QLQ4_9RHOB|nr:glycosyltransferase family A protein [Salipiger mucosus]EPX80518.1 glucosyltransferase [Salipiger mucosus DSM 16094]
MPQASIVVPAFNAADTLGETLRSLLAQTHPDFEIVVVDDGSTDRTVAVARGFGDARIRVVQQPNRGLAGARNSGIAAARGAFIGFCDADDLWRPTKLAAHVAHLEANPEIGLSYSGSELIDAEGRPTGLAQRPRLQGVTPAHVFRRNPVGNGSAPVFRRAALDAIAFRPEGETRRDWWFDERFRQSEDVECWLRLALTTDWDIAGIPGLLTRYRIVPGGLSAGTARQEASWEAMVTKLTPLAPAFFARHARAARAFQQRYLARRAVSSGNASEARSRMRAALATAPLALAAEPAKTLTTLTATALLSLAGPATIDALRGLARRRAA